MRSWNQNFRSIKAESCSVKTLWKTTLEATQFWLNRARLRPKWLSPKVKDVIARLPDCDGQAADAVSAYTSVKLWDAPRLLKILESECPDVWPRLPRHTWPKSWANIEDPVVLLERILHGHQSGKDVSKQLCYNVDGKKHQIGNAYSLTEKQTFLSVHVDDI